MTDNTKVVANQYMQQATELSQTIASMMLTQVILEARGDIDSNTTNKSQQSIAHMHDLMRRTVVLGVKVAALNALADD